MRRLLHGYGTATATATALALAATAAVPAVAAASASPRAQVRTGPAGPAFYRPPAALRGSAHGGVIWARRARGAAALPGAARTDLVLYRSIGVRGRAVAVSGAVSVPKGRSPNGGWPVITWAHGTTGIADACAPTRADGKSAVSVFTTYAYPLLDRWLKAGYAVVRTDYEGLGTPGDHPYLIGTSEGRSVLDMVRAARVLRPDLGRRVVVAGHSQGGQAALWAAALARRWTPELDVRGTVAFAPVSHLGEQGAALPAVSTISGGLTALAALILRGVDVASDAPVTATLSAPALALYPQTRTRCVPQLSATTSFGGLTPSALFRPGASTAPILAVLNANDAETLRIPRPVLIEQGTADTTVFPTFTDQLATALKAKGAALRYRRWPGVDHAGVVNAAAADATTWLAGRVGRVSR